MFNFLGRFVGFRLQVDEIVPSNLEGGDAIDGYLEFCKGIDGHNGRGNKI